MDATATVPRCGRRGRAWWTVLGRLKCSANHNQHVTSGACLASLFTRDCRVGTFLILVVTTFWGINRCQEWTCISQRHSIAPNLSRIWSHTWQQVNKSIKVLDGHPIYSPLKVTPTPMYQYGDEKHGVEVRNYGCWSNDRTPGKTHSPVGNIIRLARISPPTTREQTISARPVSIQVLWYETNIPMSSLDVGRIFDSVPRDLRESRAEGADALSLHLEVTLLRHGWIPTTQEIVSWNLLHLGTLPTYSKRLLKCYRWQCNQG